MKKIPLTGLTVLSMCLTLIAPQPARSAERNIYAKENIAAWCIVPFDAAKRGPVERAEMLNRLGISRLAYDWRNEHIPTFEQEILESKKHGIEFFSFWGVHEEAFKLFKKYNIIPQIWIMLPQPQDETQEKKVETAAKQILPIVNRTRELGCKLGLYNHGGWGGEPANMAAVCKWLRDNADAQHVGIVYNFHHGHEHIADFRESMNIMKPYLICINLNGMNDNAQPKILPLGQGKHEEAMMKIVLESGYQGPVGILDHRDDTDSEISLKANIDGMKILLEKMGLNEALKTYK